VHVLRPAQRATATVVCPSTGPQQQTRCTRLAAVGPAAGEFDRSLHGRRSSTRRVAGECGQWRVVSVRRKLNIDLRCWSRCVLETCCLSDSASLSLQLFVFIHVPPVSFVLLIYSLKINSLGLPILTHPVCVPNYNPSFQICLNNIWAVTTVWRLRGKIVRTAACCVVYDIVHNYTHANVSSS